MAEQAATTTKTYPRDDEDIKYEKDIVDAIKKLPLEQRLQLIALNGFTMLRKQLDVQTESQIEEIVRKYNKTQAPLMNELNQIIAGKRAVNDEEIQSAKQHLTPEETEQIPQNITSDPIPDYWFKVLTTCIRFKEDIHEVDHPLLKCLTMIENIPEEEGEDFTFKFHFAPNDYFENDVLTVKFFMESEHEVKKTESTEIKWKEGKDITKKTVEKKQKNKKTGKTRTVTKTVDAESFFTFFRSIEAPEDEDDEEEENEDAERLGINYEIAIALQDEIISHHLEYYLDLRVGDEEQDGFYPGMGDEDDEEGDEDDEEDEGHGGHKHGKHCAHGHGHGHGHKHKPAKGDDAEGGAKDGQKQECKQQ